MGQHTYRTKHEDKPITIRAGWDRPLQQFFMVVELDNEEDHTDENNGMLYSNLDDPAASGRISFKYFEDKLRELGITLPSTALQAIRNDALENGYTNNHTTSGRKS